MNGTNHCTHFHPMELVTEKSINFFFKFCDPSSKKVWFGNNKKNTQYFTTKVIPVGKKHVC